MSQSVLHRHRAVFLTVTVAEPSLMVNVHPTRRPAQRGSMETDGLYWDGTSALALRLSRWCAEIMVKRYAQGVKELAPSRVADRTASPFDMSTASSNYAVVPLSARPASTAEASSPLCQVVPNARPVSALLRDNDSGYWDLAVTAVFDHRNSSSSIHPTTC